MSDDHTGDRPHGAEVTTTRAAASIGGARRHATSRAAGLPATATALVLTAVATVLVVADARATERTGLAAEAVNAAETAALAVVDYRPETVAEDLAAAEPLLTRPFLDTFREQSREVTIPRATAGQVTSSARSTGAALAAFDGDEAIVMVFLDRHTVGSDGIPRVLQTVVEVGLRREGDQWSVSELSPR